MLGTEEGRDVPTGPAPRASRAGLKPRPGVWEDGDPFALPLPMTSLLAAVPLVEAKPSLHEEPGDTDQTEAGVRQRLAAAVAQVNRLVLGKAPQVRLAFACLLTGGHLLLEDLPGTGKTILARSLAATLDLDFRRVQFTSDLMPSDILGVSIYQPQANAFELHRGPVFTNVLLADEINRASPRAQSALLEAMAEGQVSIDRTTHKLPSPFLVIATQNPVDLVGTFPLPNAQKDRFLFQVSLGYPDRASELALMRSERRAELLDAHAPRPQLSAPDVLSLRRQVRGVVVSEALMAFAYDLVHATRTHAQLEVGLSPRASLALVEASQALAFLSGRDYATPEDVQEAFLPLAGHRVLGRGGARGGEEALLADVIRDTPAP